MHCLLWFVTLQHDTVRNCTEHYCLVGQIQYDCTSRKILIMPLCRTLCFLLFVVGVCVYIYTHTHARTRARDHGTSTNGPC